MSAPGVPYRGLSGRVLRACAAVLGMGLAGCASPSFTFEGKQCGPDNLCPGPLRCLLAEGSQTGTCVEPVPGSPTAAGDPAVLLQDDFEGPFLDSKNPPGLWHIFDPTGGVNSAVPTPDAAHRGELGVRHRDLISAEPNPGSGGAQLAVIHRFDAVSDRWYVRTWLRTDDPAFKTDGDRTVLNLKTQLSPPHICELRLKGVGQRVILGGFDATGSYEEVESTRPLPIGEWHLVELGVENVGTQQGRCALWIDGALAAERTGLDWTATVVNQLDFGQPYALDRSFTGTTDFDDLRLGSRPHATSLAIEGSFAPQVDACLPVKITLRDAAGAAALAPYPVDVVLFAEGTEAQLFSDAECLRSTTVAQIAAGRAEGVAYIQSRSAGHRVLRADHPDFLAAAELDEEVSFAPDAPVGCSTAPSATVLVLPLLVLGACAARRTSGHRARVQPLVVLTLLLGTGTVSAGGLEEARTQIRSLEPEAALKTLERERSRANITPDELAKVHLYAGLAHAQLGDVARAAESFRAARLLDPALSLPAPASPSVRELWADAAPPPTTPPPTTPPLTTPPLTTPPPTTPPGDGPKWRARLGWGLLASGIAAAAGGVYFGMQQGASARAVREEPDVGRALELARTSHSQARTANVLFGVGGTLTLGGGILIAF